MIDVLSFHAAHPTEAFTLSELADRLHLSLGSAHRVLSALVAARFLSRHPKHKTYSLGVALVAIGHAALERHRNIDIARREMEILTRELNVRCFAGAVVDDEILILAKAGTPQTHDGLSVVGERRPYLPPIGLAHVAWATNDAVAAYLATAPARLTARMHAHLLAAIKVIQRRGYALAANGEGRRALREAALLAIGNPRDEAYRKRIHHLLSKLSEREAQLLDLEDIGSEGIAYISAPVFSAAGEVALELTLSGIPYDLSARDIERYAERLRAAAAVVTSESHGRMPAYTPLATKKSVSGSRSKLTRRDRYANE